LLKLQKFEECAMKMMRGLTTIAAALLLAGCASTGLHEVGQKGTDSVPGIKPFKVKLEVVADSEGKFELAVKNEEKTRGCDKFPEKDQWGCIFAATNEMVDVEIKLSGEPGWYFAEFQICRVVGDSPKKPDKFDNDSCKMSDEERADWLVLANNGIALLSEHGRVDISSQFGEGLKQFELRDINWTEANYFYRIKACKDATTCEWTDPGAQNTGRR